MNSLEELRQKRKMIEEKDNAIFKSMDMIIKESERVADVAHNSSFILHDLDKEFEIRTGLNKTDISFLFFATALQAMRWILSPELGDTIDEKTRLDDKTGDNLVNQKKKDYSNEHENWNKKKNSKGYRPWKEIIFSSVPYDATKGAPALGINMEGRYHRYKTLGHDPLLGWVFGTVNIISETISLNNFRTFEVENMHFSTEINIFKAFQYTFESIFEDIHRLPAAVFRQGLHLESDEYTKLGLPVPGIGVFSEELAGKLYRNQYDALCFSMDLKKIGTSAMISILINMIITLIHGMYYDENVYINRDIYEVKTRKIISYSNTISSASNVIYVAIKSYLGDQTAIKKLDIGGIIVTLYRLINDYEFIRKVKEEFVFGSFDKLIQGENYSLEGI